VGVPRARGHDHGFPGAEKYDPAELLLTSANLDSGGNGKSDYQPECGSGEVQDPRRGREWSDDRGRRRDSSEKKVFVIPDILANARRGHDLLL